MGCIRDCLPGPNTGEPTRSQWRGAFFFVFLFMVYVFGLPYWSYLFNDKLGFYKELCTTPAEQVFCGDGQNYTEIAIALGRQVDGRYVGCTCGEGIIADYVCPISQEGDITSLVTPQFSISYFIGTPNATGALAALTFFPLLFIWFYSPGANSTMSVKLQSMCLLTGAGEVSSPKSYETAEELWLVTQVAFQIFYGLFLMFTLCVAPNAHTIVVTLFVIAEVSHFVAIAYYVGFSTTFGKAIGITCAVAVIVLTLGSLTNMPTFAGTNIQTYGFWLAECIGFSLILLITPTIVFFTGAESNSKFEPILNNP
eukprot:TRINITY_DN11354_c0_g2_i1.p1 TRINITY_DN11354_c0_g2~~TRINITY_DN11354_c0_g2_i1.p1  ORF type:complete len:311 (+),score=4.00 TRINITY_DN11354_c0_g2_i1:175-1107(+)